MSDSTELEAPINAVTRAMAANRRAQARLEHVRQVGANIRAHQQSSGEVINGPGDIAVHDPNISAGEATFALLNEAVKASVQSAASRAYQMRLAGDAFEDATKTGDTCKSEKIIEGEVVVEDVKAP